jgi:hypothetical protein
MVPARAGRRSRPKEGEPMVIWESEQLIDTRRTGEPFTGGRGCREYGANKGNTDRA